MRALDDRNVSRAMPATGAPPSGSEPAKTVGERLAEIDRLHAAGTITPSERDAARGRILGSI